MGSSDQVAFVNAGADNRCYLLYHAQGTGEINVNGRPIEPHAFVDGELRPHPLGDDCAYAHVFAPDTDFAGEYTFANRFTRRVDIQINDTRTHFDVYDVASSARSTQRIVERLAQARHARRRQGSTHAYHPWFPVLLIGAYKAELYTRALVGDIVHKRHNLADPGWLVRVGLYLELLTALGIVEAVRDAAICSTPGSARRSRRLVDELRAAQRRGLARRVGAARHRLPRPAAARPGGRALNLLNKRRATLEFLHVHHEDLKQAIELAGPNHTHAQETWHRVFRDAERAVLRQTPDAFPELGDLPPEVRRFVLWHRRGPRRPQARAAGARARCRGCSATRTGCSRSACNQYRGSMNHVADWARERGPDGPHGRGGGPAPGEPARGAHEPADAGRRCCSARRL